MPRALPAPCPPAQSSFNNRYAEISMYERCFLCACMFRRLCHALYNLVLCSCMKCLKCNLAILLTA